MIYESDEPVPRDRVAAVAGPLIPPAVALRAGKRMLERSRTESRKPSPNMYRSSLDDVEHLIAVGRRSQLMSTLTNMVAKGRIIRIRYNGVDCYAVGPRPYEYELTDDDAVLPV
jgi:hypothetical protein